jgi:dihydrofolate reductase
MVIVMPVGGSQNAIICTGSLHEVCCIAGSNHCSQTPLSKQRHERKLKIRRRTLRKLTVGNIMSLDGFYVVGPDWPLEILDDAFDASNAERLRAADTLLLGRTTYEGFRDFWPPVADDPNPQWTPTHREISRLEDAIDKVVVSDSLTADQTEPWRSTTRIISRADAHEQITELKRQSGKEIIVFGSHTLWNDLLAHDLVDELHLMIGPIVLSAGTPVIDGKPDVSLQLIDTRTWEGSQNVLVRYEVRHQKT